LSVLEEYLLGAPEESVDRVLEHMDPATIMRLRCLSSSLLRAVDAYATRKWNIVDSLGRWFWNIRAFLRMLDACDAIVSSSQAQQYFGRQQYSASDLDIFIPLHGLLPMGRFLRRQNYLYQPKDKVHPFFDAAALSYTSFVGHRSSSDSSSASSSQEHGYAFRAFNFVMPADVFDNKKNPGKRIQLIAVRGNPVEYIINNFHSTAVMNYLTGNYAVSLFPRTTFLRQETLVCLDITHNKPAHRAWMEKYRARGYTVLTAESCLPSLPELDHWERSVGDKMSWVLPYAHTGLPRKEPLNIHSYKFEVLSVQTGVAPAGAALRIAPRFWYSSAAYILKPADGPMFRKYRSVESAVAFLSDFWVPEEDPFPPGGTDLTETEAVSTDNDSSDTAGTAGSAEEEGGSDDDSEDQDVSEVEYAPAAQGASDVESGEETQTESLDSM
ncbi:hypothetical protein C8T65DRAFT_595192, partial [Cerioporus squamosus]